MRCLAFLLAACFLAGPAPAQPDYTGEDERRFAAALEQLQPQRPGTVDAYVVVAALDSDPVFNREAREAGRVLAGRFNAEARTITLADDEGDDRGGGAGTPEHLSRALARAAELMDKQEDVLVLYTTSHGSPRAGLNFRHDLYGAGVITPPQLAEMLTANDFQNRLIILQACFSGQFLTALSAPGTIIATAASSMTSSFGCSASNDWTFFGHALINEAMRQPDTFVRQFRRAVVTIVGWEKKLGIAPSNPQIVIGKQTSAWLSALDGEPRSVSPTPVGQPPSELAN